MIGKDIMTNLERAKLIKKELDLTVPDKKMEKVVSSLIRLFKSELIEEGETPLHGLGTLRVKNIKPRTHVLHGKVCTTRYTKQLGITPSRGLLQTLSEQ